MGSSAGRGRLWEGISVGLPLVVLVALLGPTLLNAHRSAAGDGPHLLGIAMRLGWLLRTGQVGEALWGGLSLVAPHPPGAYLPPTLLYLVLGPSDGVPILGGLLWLGVAWDGGVRLLRAQGYPISRSWVLAVGLAATPLVWSQIDNYGVDWGSAAMATQALSWLVAADGLRDRRAAVLAGVWIGAGFWVKYTFPIFLFIPCLLVIGRYLFEGVVRWGQPGVAWWARTRNGLLLTGATLAVAGPLAVLSGQNIVSYVMHSTTLEGREIIDSLGSSAGPDVSAFDRNWFYLAVLKDLWGWPGLGLIGLGLVVAAVTAPAPQRWSRVLVFSAVLGAFPVLSHLEMKADRYLLPLVVPLLGVALPALAGGWLRALLPPAIFAAPILFLWRDYSGWTHGLPLAEVTAFDAVAPALRWAPSARRFDHSAEVQLTTWGAWPKVEEPFRPITADVRAWQMESILQALHTHYGRREGHVGLCLTERTGTPGFGMFLMTAERLDLHWDLVTVMILRGREADGRLRTFQFVGPFKQGEDEEIPLEVLFVSYARGGQSPQRQYLDSLEGAEVVETFALPDGLEGKVVTLPGGRRQAPLPQ